MSNHLRNRFERGAVALTAATAIALGSAACTGSSEHSQTAATTTSTAEQTPGTHTAEEFSPSRKELTAAERAFLASVSPEKLPLMSDAEITAAFRISLDQAKTPEAYAAAFAARLEALSNCGNTDEVKSDKAGDIQEEEIGRIVKAATNGFLGYGVEDAGVSISAAVRSGLTSEIGRRAPNENIATYWLKANVVPGSVTATGDVNSAEGMSLRFTVIYKDNLNIRILQKYSTTTWMPYNDKTVYTINGLKVKNGGLNQVLPKTVDADQRF